MPSSRRGQFVVVDWRERGMRARDLALSRPLARDGYDAYRRYYDGGLPYSAGSVVYFAILTLLPFLALLVAVAAQLATTYPELRRGTVTGLSESLGISAQTASQFIAADAQATLRAFAATLGVTGVVYAGRWWVAAYRQALGVVWRIPPPRRNVVWAYVMDILLFLVLLAGLLVLVTLGLCATPAPYRILQVTGHGSPHWLQILCRLVAAVLTVLWAWVICLWLYRTIGRAPRERVVRRAAGLAGLSLAVMVVGGLFILRHVFADPVYGIAIATIGLMLWVSGAVRITLALAVWASR